MQTKTNVLIVSPYGPETNTGNWHTAQRYARFLEQGGFGVQVAIEALTPEQLRQTDVALVLHARRSWTAAQTLAKAGRPFAVVLTGTDLYADLQLPGTQAYRECCQTIESARLVVGLQSRAMERLLEILPETLHKRRVIPQTVAPLSPSDWARPFDDQAPVGFQGFQGFQGLQWLISGHVRSEKDPLTGLAGFRRAFPDGRLATGAATSLTHVGGARDPLAVEALVHEAQRAPAGHIRLLGARPHHEAVGLMQSHHCLIQPSRMEGGALVVSEAAAHRLPILASRVDGHLGLLGEDYPGYFEAGQPDDLAKRMRQFANDAGYRAALLDALVTNTPALLQPQLEQTQLKSLIERLRQP